MMKTYLPLLVTPVTLCSASAIPSSVRETNNIADTLSLVPSYGEQLRCFGGYGAEQVSPFDCIQTITMIHPDGLAEDSEAQWVPETYRQRPHTVPQIYSYGSCQLDISLQGRVLAETRGPSVIKAKGMLLSLIQKCHVHGGYYQSNHLRFTLHRSRQRSLLGVTLNTTSLPPGSQHDTGSSLDAPQNSTLGSLSGDFSIGCNPNDAHRINFWPDCTEAIGQLKDDQLPYDGKAGWGHGQQPSSPHFVPQIYSHGTCKLGVGFHNAWVGYQPNGPSVRWLQHNLGLIDTHCPDNTGGYMRYKSLIFWLGWSGAVASTQGGENNGTTSTA